MSKKDTALYDNEEQWTMVFTEVCADQQVYRPVIVDPEKVTNITKLADDRNSHEHIKEYKAYTSIVHDGQELLEAIWRLKCLNFRHFRFCRDNGTFWRFHMERDGVTTRRCSPT